jgi:cyclase
LYKLTENVYTETYVSSSTHLGCSPSFVVTSEGCILVDSPQQPSTAEEYKREVDERGGARYLIYTEPHSDHHMSAFLFDATVVGHELLKRELESPPGYSDITEWLKGHGFIEEAEHRERVKRKGKRFVAEMISASEPESAAVYKDWKFCLPSITYEGDGMRLYLGDHTFHLIWTPGHTVGQSAVYVPEEKVLFTGDTVFYRVTPLLGAKNHLFKWLDSLKKLNELDVRYVVPGHGGVCDKSGIKEQIEYFEEMIHAVQSGIERGWKREACAERLHRRFHGRYPPSRGSERIGGAWTHRNLTWTFDELTA